MNSRSGGHSWKRPDRQKISIFIIGVFNETHDGEIVFMPVLKTKRPDKWTPSSFRQFAGISKKR